MHMIRPLRVWTSLVTRNTYLFGSRIPSFSGKHSAEMNSIHILHSDQAEGKVPVHKIKEFKEKHQTVSTTLVGNGDSAKEVTQAFYNQESWAKISKISSNTSIKFSNAIRGARNFLGIASEVLIKGYNFSRKQKDEKSVELALQQDTPSKEYLIELASSKIRAAEWANSRGNQATTLYMLEQAQNIAQKYPELKMTVIRGKELLDQNFRLMHAVGRASSNEPIMVSLEWRGDSTSEDFISLVGKGVCFDAGGLNLKPTTAIGGMHNDKHGACSVLSALEGVARLKLKANVVATIGLVENFVGPDSFRPLDIIESRKGLTVEIGNTDAEGRLVLADCMNWVQEKYKVKSMLDMATLTGAVVIALGKNRAGVFSNSDQLAGQLSLIGEEIGEKTWRLPIDQYHHDIIKAKHADITNASKKPEAHSSQAAAFLENFVEKGVQWAHIDIAGTGDQDSTSTGYGAKLLLHWINSQIQKKQ